MATTIHAQVSPSILNKADRLFSNRLSAVFVELLQNARRANATRVDVETTAEDGHSRITVRDNGDGISDFSKLLNLGASDWDEATTLDEDPAGMGFFSLIHSGVTVRSNGHEAAISKEGFLGVEAVTVNKQKRPSPDHGTELIFRRPESLIDIDTMLTRVALFGPVKVMLNGVILPRQDFLNEAISIKEVEGVRIGVFPAHGGYHETEMNFYGNTIKAVDNGFRLEDVRLGNPSGASLSVRLDVRSASRLRLKLPDRTAVVEDEAFAELKKQARIAMYEALRDIEGGHTASFVQFEEARTLGVELCAPVLYLRRFAVTNEDAESFGGEFDYTREAYDPSRVAIVKLDNDREDYFPFTFEQALETHPLPEGRTAVYPEPRFVGYPSYDSIPSVSSFALKINGLPEEAESEAAETLTIVDSIKLRFAFQGAAHTWNLDFAGWANGDGYREATLFITKKSAWAENRIEDEPFILADAAQFLAFSYAEEGDSYDTQTSECYERLSTEILSVLGGEINLARQQVKKALGWNLTSALDKAEISEVRLFKDKEGHWAFTLDGQAA